MENNLYISKKIPVFRRHFGNICQKFYPSKNFCISCRVPWRFTKPHGTKLTEDVGIFVLCEYCWVRLTVEERSYYYAVFWGIVRADKDIFGPSFIDGLSWYDVRETIKEKLKQDVE